MKEKTIDEILNQKYMTAKDLTLVIPGLDIRKARTYISSIQEEMNKQNYFVPSTKVKVGLTKLIRKKLGI